MKEVRKVGKRKGSKNYEEMMKRKWKEEGKRKSERKTR